MEAGGGSIGLTGSVMRLSAERAVGAVDERYPSVRFSDAA